MLHHSSETIPLAVQDHPEWHRGRELYSLWLIELDDQAVHPRVEAARKHLGGLLHSTYARQPHITLFVCGFLVDVPRFDDDFSMQQVLLQERALHDAAIAAFRVDIGGLNSFSTAPFLEVVDRDGGIERVRAILSCTESEIGRSTFIPHVTVGLYGGTFRSEDVVQRISSFPTDVCSCTVSRITFATYQARETAGALTYRCAVPLPPD